MQAETPVPAPEEELPEPVGYGHQCKFCGHWFYTTEYHAHMDLELDLLLFASAT